MAPKSFFNGKIFNDKFHIIEEGVICSNMGFFDMSKPKGTDFDIQADSVTIGQVDTTSQAWSDVYRVKVFDESYKAVMAAITIICDNVVDASRE